MRRKFAGISLKNKVVMGVINLSSRTFYDGSFIRNAEEAAIRAEEMVKGGADIIDLGGMSTGPGVEPISVGREKDLLLPALEAVRERIEKPISVDTQRAEVAEESLMEGGDIINDVSGFKADPRIPQVVADHDCSAILMASRISGRIRTAEKEGEDVKNIEEVKEALKVSLQICRDHQIDLDKVALDPAIGFGRGADWDLRALADLDSLQELNRPICIGVSRKSFIGKVLGIDKPSDRLPASLGATAIAAMKGADIIRTHDPRETSQFIRMIEAIQRKEGL